MKDTDKKQNTENPSKNYDLKSDAVEELVNADTGDVPEYSREELERYRSRKGIRIPEALKILFIKLWFAGAVCYFFLWGLGTYVSSLIDMLFILGVGLGMVTDLLTNNVIRFFEKTPGENDKWLLVTKRGITGLFLNIVSAMVIILWVFILYNLINYGIVSITGNTNTVPLGVEPIGFGLLSMAADMLLVLMKRTVGSIIRDAKAAAGGAGNRND